MYALEHLASCGQGNRRRWTRCGVCGNRTLLERVRMGQKDPEHWRIMPLSNESHHKRRRKAA